jgi:hypothetical protein
MSFPKSSSAPVAAAVLALFVLGLAACAVRARSEEARMPRPTENWLDEGAEEAQRRFRAEPRLPLGLRAAGAGRGVERRRRREHARRRHGGLPRRLRGALPGLVPPYGEILVDLGSPRLFAASLSASFGSATLFSFPVPNDPSFAGQTAACQAAVLGGGVELCNALDIVAGY